MTYHREIDGLRALAAIVVLAFHTNLPGFGGGFLGVDLFFVLSGFLTTSLLVPQIESFSPDGFRRFLSRRLWRLWPLLLAFCAILALALWLVGLGSPAALLNAALFLGNTDRAVLGYASYSVHTWSLAAEMQFYVLLALLAFVLRSARQLQAALMAGFLAVTLCRVVFALSGDWGGGFYSPFAHSSGLFLGGLLATMPRRQMHHAPVACAAALLVLAAAVTVAVFRSYGALLLWITFTELATAVLLMALLSGRAGVVARVLGLRPLVWFGQLSYGVYLWHYPLSVLLRDALPPLVTFLATLVISLALAAASFRWLEAPLRRYGNARTQRIRPSAPLHGATG
ncbi:acyltransferase [Oceanicola sp. D3]|uniref:acyltransferase family protein n=1 Tax=Oceanicola sp. D3 TaxID=2587163 RepID=UPI0011243AB7|nr:acyltransferase [Oceanicola sp. D3]QDC08721.1 acyltransferase [Oceanicola sp. D3]